MTKVLTAEEFIEQYATWTVQDSPDTMTTVIDKADCLEAMKQFTKLHVKAALETASKKATFDLIGWNEGEIYEINKDSILNAYPENLIQ